jgi:hypothetical protein
MPRPLPRVRLESGLKLNLNSLARQDIIKPGAITGPVGIAWMDGSGEENASGYVTADLSDEHGRWKTYNRMVERFDRLRSHGRGRPSRGGHAAGCTARLAKRFRFYEMLAALDSKWLRGTVPGFADTLKRVLAGVIDDSDPDADDRALSCYTQPRTASRCGAQW